jgi:hypothetical protein
MDGEELASHDGHRPLGLILLSGLYAFFFMVSVSTFGNPFPFFGQMHVGQPARTLVFLDSLACLYLLMGLYKRQRLTWYLLMVYNLLQILNIIVNLSILPVSVLEQALGQPINVQALTVNNIAAALALLLVTQYIFRHGEFFTNRSRYLF